MILNKVSDTSNMVLRESSSTIKVNDNIWNRETDFRRGERTFNCGGWKLSSNVIVLRHWKRLVHRFHWVQFVFQCAIPCSIRVAIPDPRWFYRYVIYVFCEFSTLLLINKTRIMFRESFSFPQLRLLLLLPLIMLILTPGDYYVVKIEICLLTGKLRRILIRI